MPTELHLLVPALLGTWPPATYVPAVSAPALQWLLSRARLRRVAETSAALLCALFGVQYPADGDVPVAALTALADGLPAHQGWWLRADPLHFHADAYAVLLVDARRVAPQAAEVAALAAAFNQHFAADALQLLITSPERGYLQLPTEPALRTHSLDQALGCNISPLLPQGDDAPRWHRLLTEAQMLFHQHPVNQARQAHHQLTINGLWLWGGGVLPPAGHTDLSTAYADTPLVAGLAQLSGVTVRPLPTHFAEVQEALLGDAHSLLLLENVALHRADDDVVAWAQEITQLEQNWFAPALHQLRTGNISALHVYCAAGRCYSVTRSARWRFWRRTRPIAALSCCAGAAI